MEMRKKLLAGLITGILVSGLSSTAFGTTLATYEFTISGNQLMSYATANGGDTDSAIATGLYDGGRRFQNWDTTNGWGEAYRSYQTSSQGDFVNWAANGDRLVDFNLWGHGGNGSNWGEIYNLNDWPNSPTSTDANWNGYVSNSTYGEILGWSAPDSNPYSTGLGFGAGEANATFTFQLTLDMDNPAFNGNTSPWHNGQEGQMVFWFGGWTMDASDSWTGLYEGNMILQGQEVVPEPTTVLLFGIGMVGLIGIHFRRKRK
jgi:hypothetical protein